MRQLRPNVLLFRVQERSLYGSSYLPNKKTKTKKKNHLPPGNRSHAVECNKDIPNPLPLNVFPRLLWPCLLALSGPDAAQVHDHIRHFSYSIGDDIDHRQRLEYLVQATDLLPTLLPEYRSPQRLVNLARSLLQAGLEVSVHGERVAFGFPSLDMPLPDVPPFEDAPPEQARSISAGGVYPKLQYINHACPGSLKINVKHSGPTTALLLLITTRRIRAGEELFWSYLEGDMPHVARRERLFRHYGFWCECDVCTAVCITCGSKQNLKQCSRCKRLKYCSLACQKQDYPRHKNSCK